MTHFKSFFESSNRSLTFVPLQPGGCQTARLFCFVLSWLLIAYGGGIPITHSTYSRRMYISRWRVYGCSTLFF